MQKKLPLINSAHGSETRNIINEIIKSVNDRGLEILSESGFLTWLDENGIKHREEVATVADLPSNDSLNTVRGVFEDNKIYIKKENGWVPFQTIDISKINQVEYDQEATAYVFHPFPLDNIEDRINSFYQDLPEDTTFKLPPGNYEFSKKLIFDRKVNLDLKGVTIRYYGSGTAIQIGSFDRAVHRIRAELPELLNNVVDWNIESTGVHLINLYSSQFHNVHAEGFKDNVVIDAQNNTGNSYNSYYLNRIVDGLRSLVITSKNKGWSNENSFYGGRFGWTSARSSEMSNKNVHVYFEFNDYSQNNNRFYGCSFESGAGVGVEYAVYMEDGRMNYFRECRYEGAAKIHLEKSLDTQFTDGFGLEKVEFTGIEPSVIRSTEENKNRARGTYKYSNMTSENIKVISIETPVGDNAIDFYGNGNIHSTGFGYHRRGVRWYSLQEGEARGIFEGVGSPEGKVVAAPGSIYLNASGGNETLFVKEGNKDSTGWVLYTKPEARKSTAYHPRFIGDIAVRNGIAHVAVGLTNEDWVQITN